MADLVSPILDVGSRLWDTVANHAVYSCNLKENLESLEVAMERLKQVYEDVKQRVETDELNLMKRTNEVGGWLDRVPSMEAEVNKILQEGKELEQKKCLGGCCTTNCRSRYKVGKKVSKMFNKVNELRTVCSFNVVARGLGRAPVNEKPMEKSVGLDSMVEKVWRCIEDTNLQTVGLYGLGGVGKTTLLKKINNEFLNRSHGFETVIWVSVSKQPNLEKIQEEIWREIQIPDRNWQGESEEKKAETIYSILKEKKFVLLLDDIWKRLDLVQLGVLNHDQDMQKGSKVIFTTRSLEICGLMEAKQKIKVDCLTPEVALALFRTKVGEDALINRRISKLAEIMVAECKGLPLALVTVGRAMASRMNPEEWEQAISILRNSPSQFPGMNDVLHLLKFSFDRLHNTTFKSCFLYCCIFPEDYNIRKEELIELWLGEGFLDEFVDCFRDKLGGLSNVRKKGEYIIGSLKQTCLLESGESEEFVTMHHLIRDMALMECRDKIKIYVKEGESTQAYGPGSWNEIETISLWDHGIEDLPMKDSQLLNVRTLICKLPLLYTFPTGFFHLMPGLTVLDLSNSYVLSELPVEIGKLINLQYLNLSETAIYEQPTALGNLTKLRCLLLDCRRLKITGKMISNFQLLEVFSTRLCDEGLLDELEHLEAVSEISIAISTATSLTRLLHSPKLQQCLKKLNFSDRSYLGPEEVYVSPSLLRRMEHLELNSPAVFKISLEIGSVQHHYFDNLCRVMINNSRMSDVTWLIYAPRLQHLTLTNCKFMKEVIGGTSRVAEIEENAELFSSLITLHLEGLSMLESICPRALDFPLLMKIAVQECPNLKTLPFNYNSAKNSLKQIYGGRNWWGRLQWEDEAIKQVFSSRFVENPHER